MLILSRYADQTALQSHLESPVFKDFVSKLEEEKLVTGPPSVKTVEPVGGFLSRV